MIDCYNTNNTGVFTGKIIRMISDIRAKHGKDSVNLKNCGKFTLAEDLSDISDMTSIDLSSIYSLEGRCCSEELSFPGLQTSALFLEEFSFLRILREFSRVARRTCRKFLKISSLHSNYLAIWLTHTCPACLSILFQSGDIQVLGNCKQLTSADFWSCSKITGACCFEERSFSRLRTSALFWKKFLLSEFCANFLEWLAELAENSWKFPRSFRRSLTPALPACQSYSTQATSRCSEIACS